VPQLALAPTRLVGSVKALQLPYYVPNWTTTPPAPTITPTTAPIASTMTIMLLRLVNVAGYTYIFFGFLDAHSMYSHSWP
jgi:hypothetical protein